MGIKIGKHITGHELIPGELNGTFAAVDALNTIMTFLKRKYGRNFSGNSHSYGEYVTDRTQRAITHLYGIFYRNIKLLENNIIPVYCFDGKPDPLKRVITKDLIVSFRQTKLRYEKALEKGNREKAKLIALGRNFLWENAIKETKNLLTYMGIPFIASPTEGEAQCAQLVKMGICDYVISADFDTLFYGSQKLLKIKGFKGKKMEGILYELDGLQRQLGLNRFQLIDLSILIGNDYFPGIHSIGVKTGVKLLQKYQSIEKIITYDSVAGTLINQNISKNKIMKIRKLFLSPDVLTKIPDLNLTFPKRGGIETLMCGDHNLSRERVKKGIDRLIKVHKKIRKIKK
jgi:flap endonuclease-1